MLFCFVFFTHTHLLTEDKNRRHSGGEVQVEVGEEGRLQDLPTFEEQRHCGGEVEAEVGVEGEPHVSHPHHLAAIMVYVELLQQQAPEHRPQWSALKVGHQHCHTCQYNQRVKGKSLKTSSCQNNGS